MSFKERLSHFIMKYLAVPRSPKIIPGKTHIACIGDSITYGAGVLGKKNQTFEYFMNEILGENVQVINYGISGRTLQKEGDYPYTADKFYKESKESKAEIYLIMLGTNDSKPQNWNRERYEKQLRAFTKEYKELPHHPEVILMIPPTCFKEYETNEVAFDIREEIIEHEIVGIVRATGEELQVKVIDLHTFTQGHSDWFVDGVHPNLEGNKALGRKIAGEVSRAGVSL